MILSHVRLRAFDRDDGKRVEENLSRDGWEPLRCAIARRAILKTWTRELPKRPSERLIWRDRTSYARCCWPRLFAIGAVAPGERMTVVAVG